MLMRWRWPWWWWWKNTVTANLHMEGRNRQWTEEWLTNDDKWQVFIILRLLGSLSFLGVILSAKRVVNKFTWTNSKQIDYHLSIEKNVWWFSPSQEVQQTSWLEEIAKLKQGSLTTPVNVAVFFMVSWFFVFILINPEFIYLRNKVYTSVSVGGCLKSIKRISHPFISSFQNGCQ